MKKVFVDTSFLIKLLHNQEALHPNALAYFKYFLEEKMILVVSAIAIGEYCVQGQITHLPLKNLQTLNYNVIHAVKAGRYGAVALRARQANQLPPNRLTITNDIKLFAQAESEKIDYYVTADAGSKAIYDLLRREDTVSYTFIDIHTPVNETFGLLF
jgi:predicted nucleic acid-binding protein